MIISHTHYFQFKGMDYQAVIVRNNGEAWGRWCRAFDTLGHCEGGPGYTFEFADDAYDDCDADLLNELEEAARLELTASNASV